MDLEHGQCFANELLESDASLLLLGLNNKFTLLMVLYYMYELHRLCRVQGKTERSEFSKSRDYGVGKKTLHHGVETEASAGLMVKVETEAPSASSYISLLVVRTWPVGEQ